MRGRAARLVRWLGIAAAIAIPTGATAFVVAGPAGATDPPAHVTFTADGVKGDDVTINPGTDVVFSNDIDPLALGLLHSVTVKVAGATQRDFTVQPDKSVTVSGYNSGSQPFVVHYSATYQSTTVILIPGTDGKYDGTITVAATKPSSPAPTTQSSTAPPGQPSHTPTQQPTAKASTTSASSSSSGQSSASDPTSTIPGYQQPGPDVASQVVPKGDGGRYTTDGTSSNTNTSSRARTHHRTASTTAHQSSAKRSSSSSTTDVAAGDPVTRPAARNSANEQQLDTAASQTGALPTSFNWPAIAAVALLSTVGVALVRTFAAHRRGN